MAHALRFPPIGVVVRALDNPRLNAWIEALRTSTGNSVIHRRGALRQILRALGDNKGVAILIDQHIQTSEAVVVDFFNRPAATTSAVAALALRTGAPIVPVFAVRLPGGRYRMIYEHPVVPPDGRSSRRRPRADAALHRRPRDVRAPLSEQLAVDAPALARPAARRGHPGHVPGRSPRGMTRLVVRAPNWLGDIVMAFPAIAAVRAAHPGAHLAVAAPAPFADVCAALPGVDAVVPLRGSASAPSARTRRRCAADGFDLGHPVHQLVRQRPGRVARRHRGALGLSPRLAGPAADAAVPVAKPAAAKCGAPSLPGRRCSTTAPTICGWSRRWAWTRWTRRAR